MNMVASPEHKKVAGRVRELMAKYQEVELLVKIGEYKRGADSMADQAIDRIEGIRKFLRQATDEFIDYEETISLMKKAVA
jgi:type III secretion protein N (ATPase)